MTDQSGGNQPAREEAVELPVLTVGPKEQIAVGHDERALEGGQWGEDRGLGLEESREDIVMGHGWTP